MRPFVFSLLFAALVAGPGLASGRAQSGDAAVAISSDRTSTSDPVVDAQRDLADAAHVVSNMTSRRPLRELLGRARGVFIMPSAPAADGAVVVGTGRSGVLLVRNAEGWSDPVFCNIGSFGVGKSSPSGEVAMLLMTDRAVKGLTSTSMFSMGTALNVVNWGDTQSGTPGTADVIVWSSSGAEPGAKLGATSISPDARQNEAYYQSTESTPEAILSGRLTRPTPEATALKNELSEPDSAQ
jgi:lipid-binding SYLF domain-containing protein